MGLRLFIQKGDNLCVSSIERVSKSLVNYLPVPPDARNTVEEQIVNDIGFENSAGLAEELARLMSRSISPEGHDS